GWPPDTPDAEVQSVRCVGSWSGESPDTRAMVQLFAGEAFACRRAPSVGESGSGPGPGGRARRSATGQADRSLQPKQARVEGEGSGWAGRGVVPGSTASRGLLSSGLRLLSNLPNQLWEGLRAAQRLEIPVLLQPGAVPRLLEVAARLRLAEHLDGAG